MKLSIRFSAIFIILSGLISCDNSDTPNPVLTPPIPLTTTFNASLNGASEVPNNTSRASGTATLTFDEIMKTFSLTITYSGFTPTDGHLHKIEVTNGPIVFSLTNLTSPITYTSPALTSAQEADLKANLYYINLNSTAFPNGEIRGQLIKKGTQAPFTEYFDTTLDGISEVPTNGSPATGTAELFFNSTTKRFSVTVLHNVAGATSAHIHKGQFGTNGDIVFSLDSTSSTNYNYTSPVLTTEQEEDLKNNLYYINIRSSPPYSMGEIRGQLLYWHW